MQHEIKEQHRLLDDLGNLSEPGYAKKQCSIYNRENINAPAFRIKEWDYYLITGPRYSLGLTIADNGYAGIDRVSLVSLGKKPWEKTVSSVIPFTLGKRSLPSSSMDGDVSVQHPGWNMSFQHSEKGRFLHADIKKFGELGSLRADILLTDEPKESMAISIPFEKPGCFCYNQKINCLRASGRVIVGGHEVIFEPKNSFALINWSRGVWPYENTWYWGSYSGYDADGKIFGFNIGCGYGNTSAATENMLFYEGKAHKLNRVDFKIPLHHGVPSTAKEWQFTSDDGRFEMTFQPVLDRVSDINFGVLQFNQHQVFGRYNGEAVLDDGTVITVKDALGFAEKVYNKW